MSSLRNAYDYIVCGAGPAGCIVAGRLAAGGADVLLVEAGPSASGPEVEQTALWPTNIGGERDWQFESEPERELDGRTIALSMGRGLGGGSSINALVWARGHRRDWNDLADAAGDRDWSYENVLSIYRDLERYAGGDDRHHGRSGPIDVEQNLPGAGGGVGDLGAAFLRATAVDGIPVFTEQNGALQESTSGASVTDLATRQGRRSSVVAAFLPDAVRSGRLDIASDTTVSRVRIRDRRAVGVEIVCDGETRFVAAGSEIVLAAGAIGTPAVLERSGIGDRQTLGDVGIECVVPVPGVGRGLQDHPLVSSVWRTSALSSVSPSAQAVAFLNCGEASDAPDVYLLATEVPAQSSDTVTWSVGAALLAPVSRGAVHVRDVDPFRPPSIRLDYLAEPEDMSTLVRALDVAQRLGGSDAMSSFRGERLAGPEGTASEDFEAYVRAGVRSGWHFSASCRMGTDDDAVVDGSLRVRDVRGLRIADTSVLPSVFRGNTMAPAIVVGERAARILARSSE